MFLCILIDRIYEDIEVTVGTRAELLGNTVHEVGQRVFFGFLTGRSELRLFDQYVVDMLVNAVANVTFAVGNNFRRVQTGNINSYLYVVVGAVVAVLIIKLRYWS